MRALTRQGGRIRAGFARVRDELGVPVAFPDAVLVEAAEAARSPRLPDDDGRDLPFWTLDPEGSTDLDQAVHLARRGKGYRVHYAIAMVDAFVQPGRALDAETRARGLTLYSPDGRTPLHPEVLSEDAASLLPGEDRPAYVWRLDLGSAGELVDVGVRPMMVRSRAQLDYVTAQRELDAGVGDEQLELLREVGRLRQQQERGRGGVDLPSAEQEVVEHGPGYRLVYRAPDPMEGWNAQISLLTGMAAARIMLEGHVGLLRTMPPPEERDLARVHRTAAGLGIEWPDDESYPDLIRRLDPHEASHAAFLNLVTVLLRGAGYEAFDGSDPVVATHSAVAAPYAHATAPLRRLGDRFVLVVCAALLAGQEPPAWVRAALPDLPRLLDQATARARALERANVDLVEAVLLEDRIGDVFPGVVVEERDSSSMVQLHHPAVRARCGGELPLGEHVWVRLVEARVDGRRVAFERAEGPVEA